MGLCRSASSSHPAPVPRCCGGAAWMEGRTLPVSSCPGRRWQRVPARQRKEPSKSPQATEAEAGLPFLYGQLMAGKDHACPCVLPERGGHQPGTANSLDKSCAMVCHKSRKFLFFMGRVLWTALASFGAKSRYGQIHAQWRQEPDGLVQGAERKKGVERPGCQGGTVRGCRIGPWRKRLLPCLAYAGNTMPEEGTSGRVQYQRFTESCPGPTGHCIFQRFGIVPSFIEKIALIKRAGRGRKFEGGGTFSRWQKVPPPSRKQPLLRAGGIRASGH